jgi:hypothetical protein
MLMVVKKVQKVQRMKRMKWVKRVNCCLSPQDGLVFIPVTEHVCQPRWRRVL